MTPSQPTTAPRLWILAGPNGSRKTTFAREFLPAEGNCPTFINADLIAEGLSPFHPESMAVEASRLMLEHVRQMVANFHQYYRNAVDAWQLFDAPVTAQSAAGPLARWPSRPCHAR